MRRIAMAVPRAQPCGIADYADALADALAPSASVTWIDLAGCRAPGDFRKAAGLAAGHDAAIVHYTYEFFRHVSPFRNGYAAFMAALPVPAVAIMHDALPRLDGSLPVPAARRLALRLLYTALAPGWEARQYRRAAVVVAHSPDIAARACRALDDRRVLALPHPVRRTPHAWTPPADGNIHLVTPGFIKAHKGYDDGLAVLAAHPSWRWTLAGGPREARDEAYAASLLDAARQLGVQARLAITGYLPAAELEARCAAAHAAFFPFRTVTGSGSMTWAIGLGLPIVATELPATRWLEADGAGIALIPAGASATWPACLGAKLGAPAALAELARRNRAYAAGHGYDHLAKQLLPWLERCAARMKRSAS